MQPVPWVILVTGPPGSGKSSVGAALARHLGAALLDQDSMTNPLVDVVARSIGATSYDDPALSALVREARYECVFSAALDCVRSGTNSVLIAPFTQERRHLDTWQQLATRISQAGGKPAMAWIRIDADELSRRLSRRGATRDANKLENLQNYLAGLDLAPPVGPFVEVDAHSTIKQQVKDLAQELIQLH